MFNEGDERLTRIEATLGQIGERFEREMRARGFDPAQAENVALPGSLAKLYAEREDLRALLEELRLKEV